MLDTILMEAFIDAYQQLYEKHPDLNNVVFQKTRPDFDGDMTIVVFPFVKELKKSPEQIGKELGEKICEILPAVSSFNVVKGFLNLLIADDYWIDFFNHNFQNPQFGNASKPSGQRYVIEYSSPNTNKPLHLGHVRNNLLGWSVAEILKANGHEVIKVNLVNDRGIHICKSMLAWKKWSGKSPDEVQVKGDKLVGEMYVRFDKEYKAQIAELIAGGENEDTAAKNAPLIKEAQQMLRDWENGDTSTRELWHEMNTWVYAGFDQTYRMLGVDFDNTYYESDTYLLGKNIVMEGIESGTLYQKSDGSVWCNLTSDGLDEKLLLRSDGTSVYMTQDLGTAQQRMDEYQADKMVYVVGNEQNYHFDVLKLILSKMGKDWAANIEHLSYGMVELPEGKMKSREGTVVDADELVAEMISTSKAITMELGKAGDLPEKDAEQLFYQIGLGALKYFILKVDPKKTMLFNPADSIDFNGNTGPFIQYTHARIRSVLRKAADSGLLHNSMMAAPTALPEKEKSLIKMVHHYLTVVKQAGENRSPALIANFMYDLAKEFNQFYQSDPILKEENEALRNLRLKLCSLVAKTISHAGSLLGMQMPEKM